MANKGYMDIGADWILSVLNFLGYFCAFTFPDM